MIKQDRKHKKKIREKRLELLSLMGLNSDWYRDEESELYKKIMNCSGELRTLISDQKKIDNINLEEYHKFRNLGFSLAEISEYYGVSVNSLKKWRKNMSIKEK